MNFNTQTVDDGSNEPADVQEIIDNLGEIDINDELEFAAAPVRTLPEIRTNKAQFSREQNSQLKRSW